MRIQNLSQLTAAAPLKTDTVELPGGQELRIRELSVAQRMEFAAAVKSGDNSAPMIVEFGAIDDDNALIFSGQRDAIAATIDPVAVELIARRILVLSGLLRDRDGGKPSGEV